MDELIKTRLETILTRDDAARAEKTNAEGENRKRQEAATLTWADAVETRLKPSLDELLNKLTQHGWDARLEDVKFGFKMSLRKGDMRVFHSSAMPFVQFVLSENTLAVGVQVGTPSSSGEGTPEHSYSVQDVTPDVVHGHVIDLVEHLAKK